MTTDSTIEPVVAVAKKAAAENTGDGTIILPSGDRARLVPVSAALIDDVTSMIKDPPVPTFYNEEKDREEENPFDPAYTKALRDNEHERGLAVMDAMVMFGVELLDGVPEDGTWLVKLRWMEKRGRISLSNYDLDDPIDREFVYKRFVAVPTYLVEKIGRMSGVNPEDVEKAEASFQGS